MERVRLATIWLGGCSGCHMSFLDLDEWLMDLAARVDLVFSPFADLKSYPDQVDLALVEGAVANVEHDAFIRRVRQATRVLVALGDCAVTGNVTALRNPLGPVAPLLQQVYGLRNSENREPGTEEPVRFEAELVPVLLDRVLPVHAVVPVDLFLPGCPPPAPRIRAVLEQILAGTLPRLEGREMILFG